MDLSASGISFPAETLGRRRFGDPKNSELATRKTASRPRFGTYFCGFVAIAQHL
jgi:hypothetical protein